MLDFGAFHDKTGVKNLQTRRQFVGEQDFPTGKCLGHSRVTKFVTSILQSAIEKHRLCKTLGASNKYLYTMEDVQIVNMNKSTTNILDKQLFDEFSTRSP